MAATFNEILREQLGNSVAIVGEVVFDASYPTGGEALDIDDNTRIEFLLAGVSEGYVFEWNASTQKLLAYYADYSNASDGVLIQVPDTTDLSALGSIRVLAIGQ